jgi:hypothetical protein
LLALDDVANDLFVILQNRLPKVSQSLGSADLDLQFQRWQSAAALAVKKFYRNPPRCEKCLSGGRCYDEGRNKLRKGDKPSSHFGRSVSDEMVLCQLGQAAEKDSYASLRSIASLQRTD